MASTRYEFASTVDGNDNLWIIGGTQGLNVSHPLSTLKRFEL